MKCRYRTLCLSIQLCRFIRRTFGNPEALDLAYEGVEVIIHTPAYHGIHMGKHSEQEFYELNVTGTFNMFQSAVRQQVRRVVWLSSMSFYGSDFYAYTKKIGEQLCHFYHERHGIEVIMLRPADFTPYRAYPGAKEMIHEYGFQLPKQIQVTDLANERLELGYEPHFNFAMFMKEYKELGAT